MLGFATNPTGMGPRGYSSEELRAYFVGWWEVFIRPTTFRAMGGCGTMPAWIRSPVDRTPEAGFKIHLSATDEDADYGKAQFVVLSNEDVSYVGDNFNDKMSSIKVFQGCKCTILLGRRVQRLHVDVRCDVSGDRQTVDRRAVERSNLGHRVHRAVT